MTRILQLHPLLFALYPVTFLLASNVEEFPSAVAATPLMVSAAGALLLWASSAALLRDRVKGGLLTSLGCVLFFGHGFFRTLAEAVTPGAQGSAGTVEVVLACLECGLFGGAFFALRRARGSLRDLNRVLGTAALVLFAQPLWTIAQHEWSLRVEGEETQPETKSSTGAAPGIDLAAAPDIYFIVLDGYGRADVLKDIYGVDNTELRAYLESVGFYVASDAHANYAQTSLALAAALNMAYVKNLMPSRERNLGMLNYAIRNNRAFNRLRQNGYSLIAFASASNRVTMHDPDVFYDGQALDEFQTGLLATTVVPLVARWLELARLDPYKLHRDAILYTFEKLPQVSGANHPRIVFAHILSPHPPFVFGVDGEPFTPSHPFSTTGMGNYENYRSRYRDQVTFLSRKLRETVAEILANSERTPVIVIMGDHGPALGWLDLGMDVLVPEEHPDVIRERMSILLAVLLPGETGDSLAPYPSITPVNVMRIVLDRYIGESFGLLEDHSYFSIYRKPFQLTRVDEILDDAASATR